MANYIISLIIEIFGTQMGKVLGVTFVAMLPVIELRGAIPVAFALGLDLKTALACALIGNVLPVPFILLFLEAIFGFMKKHNILKGLVLRLEKTANLKSKKVTMYQFWGLLLFVAIPLPGTGGWTGALIASVLKMDKKAAFLSILGGILCAGAIVSLATYGLLGSILSL